MKRCILCGLIGSCLFVHAQSVSTLMGARVAGMGYASSVLGDETALFNNPGAIAKVPTPSTYFAYEVNSALTSANRTSAGFSMPTRFGVGGLGLFRFGDNFYSEQMISVGFSNKLGIASLGAKINYIQYRSEGFGTKSAVAMDFGGLVQITPQISVGAYIVNLTQSKISSDEYLPVRLVAGLGFKPSEQFFFCTEIEKDMDNKSTWRSGAEYTIHKKVFVRTGFNLNPSAAFFGLGAQARRLKIDYAIKFASILGATHQASATYQFERRSKK